MLLGQELKFKNKLCNFKRVPFSVTSLGGGYWWQAPNGLWIYIESDEEPDGEDVILA